MDLLNCTVDILNNCTVDLLNNGTVDSGPPEWQETSPLLLGPLIGETFPFTCPCKWTPHQGPSIFQDHLCLIFQADSKDGAPLHYHGQQSPQPQNDKSYLQTRQTVGPLSLWTWAGLMPGLAWARAHASAFTYGPDLTSHSDVISTQNVGSKMGTHLSGHLLVRPVVAVLQLPVGLVVHPAHMQQGHTGFQFTHCFSTHSFNIQTQMSEIHIYIITITRRS